MMVSTEVVSTKKNTSKRLSVHQDHLKTERCFGYEPEGRGS